MTDQNNAAQPGLTDDEILSLERRGNMTDDEALRFGRAIESALLSKLRAEGVQAGDERPTPAQTLAAHTDLLTYVLQDDVHNRLTPRVVDIAYTAFMQAKQPNAEDGGASDWFNDTKPVVARAIAKLREDLMEDRAALASAPVAGEACAWFTEDHLTDKSATTWDRTVAERWRAKGWPVRPLVYGDAAPQASEAVRNQALEEAATFLENNRTTWLSVRAAYEIRALKTQADKDGGDCAKGAGDVHFIAGTIVTHLNGPLDPAGVMAAARAITAWAHRQHPRTDGGGRE